jgi:UDP-galactopyranose mutase
MEFENHPSESNSNKNELSENETTLNIDLMGIDLICFSDLSWNTDFKRAEQLMTKFAKQQRVFFLEDLVEVETEHPFLLGNTLSGGVKIYIPHLPIGLPKNKIDETIKFLLDELIAKENIINFISWYYNPMALAYSQHLKAKCIIYDCIKEVSLIKNPDAELMKLESDLLKNADLVFTDGITLYEQKKNKSSNIYTIISSIDREHFAKCTSTPDPIDQAGIPHPRLGYYGVINNQLDLDLLSSIADNLCEWQFIILATEDIFEMENSPKQSNVHFLGKKQYKDLPCYLSGWDVVMLPFAKNETTKFLSPTITSESLAAGKPIVSTSIKCVVHPFGEQGLVYLADNSESFAENAKIAYISKENLDWKMKADHFLNENSWENTWKKMNDLIASFLFSKTQHAATIEYKLKDDVIKKISPAS